jgi:hypothetical protein
MTNSKKLIFLTPLIVILIIMVLLSISLTQGNTKTSTAEVKQKESESVKNESSSSFYAGLILGSLVAVELTLVIQVIRRRTKSNKTLLEDELAEEKRRQEIRGMIIGRLDLLIERYNQTAELVRDSRARSEILLISDGEKRT